MSDSSASTSRSTSTPTSTQRQAARQKNSAAANQDQSTESRLSPPQHREKRLPKGFVVELGPNVLVKDDGRTLVGGFPDAIASLTPQAQRLLTDRRITVTSAKASAFVLDLMAAGMAHPVAADLPAIDPADVTVVIPVHNRAAQLTRLLTSIHQTFAVIVVDDASDDPGVTEAIAAEHGAACVRRETNGGPGASRNTGLAHVTTPYVAFIDSDVVVDPDSLLVLARHFNDPNVAVLLPRVLGLVTGKDANWVGRYENSQSSLDLGPFPSFIHPGAATPWAPGTVTLNRTDAIRDGFVEDMAVGEDVDIVFRLNHAGWRTRYDPSIHVWHDHRTKLMTLLKRKVFYATSADPLTARHPYHVVPSLLTPTDMTLIGAALAQRRWSIPVIVGAALLTGARTYRRFHKARRLADAAPDNQPQASAADTGTQSLWQWWAVKATAGLTWRHLENLGLHLMALITRHYWPITAVASVFSKRARRAAAVAAVGDALVWWRRNRADLDLPRYFAGRRLDDISFGAGWWLGAWRSRSPRSLVPDVRPTPAPVLRSKLATIVHAAR